MEIAKKFKYKENNKSETDGIPQKAQWGVRHREPAKQERKKPPRENEIHCFKS